MGLFWVWFCRIWDYDVNEVINIFENYINFDKGIFKFCLLNELDDSFLFVGLSKLFVVFWFNYDFLSRCIVYCCFWIIYFL